MSDYKRRRLSKDERRKILRKTEGHCAYCGCELKYNEMQIDHIVPLHVGGEDRECNMLPSCKSCNHYKGGSSLEVFRKFVEKMPDTLNRSSGIMSNVDIVFARKDEEAPEEMVKQLPNCPVCGAKAYLQGNTVDGFWLGWSIGCPRYCLNDGIHGHDLNTPQEEYLAEHGFVTKEQAVAWWKKRVKLNGGGTNGEGH